MRSVLLLLLALPLLNACSSSSDSTKKSPAFRGSSNPTSRLSQCLPPSELEQLPADERSVSLPPREVFSGGDGVYKLVAGEYASEATVLGHQPQRAYLSFNGYVADSQGLRQSPVKVNCSNLREAGSSNSLNGNMNLANEISERDGSFQRSRRISFRLSSQNGSQEITETISQELGQQSGTILIEEAPPANMRVLYSVDAEGRFHLRMKFSETKSDGKVTIWLHGIYQK